MSGRILESHIWLDSWEFGWLPSLGRLIPFVGLLVAPMFR